MQLSLGNKIQPGSVIKDKRGEGVVVGWWWHHVRVRFPDNDWFIKPELLNLTGETRSVPPSPYRRKRPKAGRMRWE